MNPMIGGPNAIGDQLMLAAGGVGPVTTSGLADMFKLWTGALANWVEIVAAVIIAGAVVEATVQAVTLFFRRDVPPEAKVFLRLRLGRWLAVALEFELAADILRTAIAPSWSEIGLLAAVAAIRTALNYFGEEFDDPCGYCDNCDDGITVTEEEYAEPFPINSRVVHASLGPGMVMRYEGDHLVALFDDAGYKTLAVDLMTGEGLLHSADSQA